MTTKPVVLPALPYQETPNQSQRLKGAVPYLIVPHAWGAPVARTAAEARSRFEGTVAWLENPKVDVSAHVVYGGTLAGRPLAVQQVPWDRKAWTQAQLNSVCYSIESADAIWQRTRAGGPVVDEPGFRQLARIVAYLCKRTGIPPRWARDPRQPGVARHVDLGRLGNPNGHTDPTTDLALWRRFLALVQAEHARGGFRKTWGRGCLIPMPMEGALS